MVGSASDQRRGPVRARAGRGCEGAIFLRAEYHEAWAYESHRRPGRGRLPGPGRRPASRSSTSSRHGRCWVEVGERAALGRRRRRRGAGLRSPAPDGRHPAGRVVPIELVHPATAVVPDAGDPLRRGRPAHRYRLRLPAQRRRAVRPRAPGLPAGLRRPPAGGAGGRLGAGQHRVRRTADQHRLPDSAASRPGCPSCCSSRCSSCTWPARRRRRHGLVAALRDPVLGRALALVHAEPAASGRSSTSPRRSTCPGRSSTSGSAASSAIAPMRYLTTWRMHRRQGPPPRHDDCRSPRSPVEVGYDAEEAFSRAFKRECGTPPAVWRLRSRGS